MRPSALALVLATATLPSLAAAQPLDLVFVLDTTGSMSGEIREAKDRIHELSQALAKARPGARIRVGVVAYKDKGDEYVTKVQDLTADVERSYAFLATLSAAGGGDGPEDVLGALSAALRQIKWDPSPKTERQLFIIADAPPHLDYPDRPTPEKLVADALDRRIAVNVIGCRSLPGDGLTFFRKLAYAAEGSYQHIGRVQAGESLAEAMLQTLAPAVPEDLSRLPAAELVLERGGERAPVGQGLAVIPWSTGDGRTRRCGLQIEVPPGYEVTGTPDVRVGADVLHVRLELRGGQGRPRRGLCAAGARFRRPWNRPERAPDPGRGSAPGRVRAPLVSPVTAGAGAEMFLMRAAFRL